MQAWSFGNMAPDSHAPEVRVEPGVVIGGRYQVLESLGTGSQGEVLRAQDLQLERPVAIKLLKGAARDIPRERFLREGELTASLSHPNIVRLYAGGLTEAGRPFWVLELLNNPVTIDEYVRHRPLAERVRLFSDVCRGVAAAHERGIVHRDLKPSNLLVDNAGRVRVCDFGLGVRLGSKAPGEMSLTQSGTLIGTPLYMSPESLVTSESTRGPAQDVWALGVLFYQLLTDELPFKGATLLELGASIQRGATSPESKAREVPPPLAKICMRCLRRDPVDRFVDARELVLAIEDALRVPWTGRSSPRFGAALLVACALAGGVWLAARPLGTTSEPPPPPPPPPVTTTPVDPPAPLEPIGYVFPDTDAEYITQLEEALKASNLDRLEVLINAGLEQGHPDALQVQGLLYQRGLGFSKDPRRAVDLFRRAARAGSVRGMLSLAYCLEEGRGITADLGEAQRLYRRAASLGAASAHARLGYHFLRGIGVKRDLKEAERHLLAGVEGDPQAAFWLAELAQGQRRPSEVERWLRSAAVRDHWKAAYDLGSWLISDGRIGEGLSWVRRAGEAGQPQAQCRLASFYLEGDLVEKDELQAFEWVKKASKTSALGVYNLGVFYNRGYGVEEDPVRARELFLEAAERGDTDGAFSAYLVLAKGRGGPADEVEALHWLGVAAKGDKLEALAVLGKLTMLGRTPQSARMEKKQRHERALPMLERASKLKTAELWYNYGYCLGFLEDHEGAIEWLGKAARAGYAPAYSTLGEVFCAESEFRDLERAERWLKKAAKFKQRRGFMGLGRIYEGEYGQEPDYVRAREIYTQAVELGSTGAMFRLANLLKGEQGGPRDWPRARALLENALELERVTDDPDPTFVVAIKELLATLQE